MTIRRTLIGFFLLLGLGLCISVALQTLTALSELREARELTRSNRARELLARAAVAVAEERTTAYLSLLGDPAATVTVEDLHKETNQVLQETVTALRLVEEGRSTAALEPLGEALDSLSDKVEEARTRPEGEPREAAAEILEGYSQVVDELISLRVALLGQEHPADPATAAAFQMRRYLSVMLERLSLNQALIGGLLTGSTPDAAQAAWGKIRRNADQAALAYRFLAGQTGLDSRPIRLKLAALEVAYSDRYRPMERNLLARPETEVLLSPQGTVQSNAYVMLWSARDIARIGADLQEGLLAYSSARLNQQQRQATLQAVLWVTIFLIGLATVVAGTWTVLHKVIGPLDRLRGSMLALAEGDLSTPLPEDSRKDEIGAMADTMRVFKANAIRRERLQAERVTLHERLRDAHTQLRQDLEAASAVQASLLPRPAQLGSITFSGELRPSHFISGDTYDVLQQPNGPVHFFLADVAGHGAAAALVSVASRYAVIEALLRRQNGDSLAETVAALNDDWPEHLPYFTMIMGELRAEDAEGALVQAGHPPPLLVRTSGSVEMIGQGGLPVGVIRGAEYDEIRFSFGPGDRLLVYSDGLSEAENPSGQPFTEERLVELVQAHSMAATEELLAAVTEAVRDWRASDMMEDDMTLLILEANDEAGGASVPQ